MQLEAYKEFLTLEPSKPLQREPPDTPASHIVIPPAVSLGTRTFYRELPHRHVTLWVAAVLGTFAVHVLVAYLWFMHQPLEPAGTKTDAILLDLAVSEPAPDLLLEPIPLDQKSSEGPPSLRETVEMSPAHSESQTVSGSQTTVSEPKAAPDVAAILEPPKPDRTIESEEPRLEEQQRDSRRLADEKKREFARRAKLASDQLRKEQQKRETAEKTKAARSQTQAAQAKAATPAAAAASEMLGWRSALFARIAAAKRGGVNGTGSAAVIAFSVDRYGHIGGIRVARSSGSSSLDEEAAATVRRASIAPPPPGGSVQSVSISMR